MRVRDYTKAALEILTDGKSHAGFLDNLKKVLKERRHDRLYPKILKELSAALTRMEKKDKVSVTLAKDSDHIKLKEDIAKAIAELNGADYEVTIDPTIVGGFIAEGGEARIDASYKKSLLTLYRSLIA